jgi:hypothetical protein
MKVSLKGLLSNARASCKSGDKQYGSMHAYCLEELERHIQELVDGKHTIEEFAEFYCVERSLKVEQKGEGAQ